MAVEPVGQARWFAVAALAVAGVPITDVYSARQTLGRLKLSLSVQAGLWAPAALVGATTLEQTAEPVELLLSEQ